MLEQIENRMVVDSEWILIEKEEMGEEIEDDEQRISRARWNQ